MSEPGAPTPPRGSDRRRLRRAPPWMARLRGGVQRAADRLFGANLVWSTAFASVIVLLLAGERCAGGFPRLAVGAPAPYDVRAFDDVEVPDEAATAERRTAARAAVPGVHVHDTQKAAALERAFAQELDATIELPPAERQLAIGWLREAMGGLLVANKSLLSRASAITVVEIPQRRERTLHEYASITDLEAARNLARRRVADLLTLAPSVRMSLADLLASFLDVNLAEDVSATAERREQAARSVLPVLLRVPKGTVLVARGQVVSPEILVRLEAIEARTSPRTTVVRFASLVVLAVFLAFFLRRYATYHQRHFKRVKHLHALLASILIAIVLLAQGILWLAEQVAPRLQAPLNDPTAYVYLVPLAAGAILVALLANGRIAMVFSAFAAILFGMLRGWDLPITLWALLTQWAGVYAITSYRERAALLRAGLAAGGAGGLVALAVESIRNVHEPIAHDLFVAGLAIVGGAIGVGLVVSFALPLLEGLFGVLTDIRLLELSSSSNPLLSQLAVTAPGSYNHSLIVGTLAEEAAKAIGANALFCRVAAFYHDIGKIRKPEYYIENQRGVNPHDRLAPSMSALIVSAHVKDGVRMAREAGIPEQIVDIIPQHHGTRLMTYFFEKAKRQAAVHGTEVNDDDFRYPGPKPQTKEAAIFMLADGVEAAARTIDDPNASRLKEMIHQIAGRIVLDGQLDACDLTFADLERIERAFHRTLVSMYHQRVDYPGFEFGRAKAEAPAQGGEVRPFRPPS